MLASLILDSFKAFGSRQVIPLAPITLIFGANSAGKSSILQSLLLLKQTYAEAEHSNTLLLPKGDLVDLGSFRDMIFQHDVGRICEIAPILAPETSPTLWSSRTRPAFLSNSKQPAGLGFQFGFDQADRTIDLYALRYYQSDLVEPAYSFIRTTPLDRPNRSPIARFSHSQDLNDYTRYAKLQDINGAHPLWLEYFNSNRIAIRERYERTLRRGLESLPAADQRPNSPRVRPDILMFVDQDGQDETALLRLAREMQKILDERLRVSGQLDLEMFLQQTALSNSLRALSLKNFLPDSMVWLQHRGTNMEYAFQQWFEYESSVYGEPFPNLTNLTVATASRLRHELDNMVYLGPLREYPERYYIFGGNVARDVGKSGRMLSDVLFRQPELVERTNNVLKEFKIGYRLKVDQIDQLQLDMEDVFWLRLLDVGSGTTVSMMDVGFGISQVLPVIVQSMLSRGSIILIEQPEIHLHPRLQAELGSLFAQCIAEPYNNQFIIETHSEHLVLRLQRLVRERILKPSDISVIYVMKDSNGSACFPIRLDRDGDFIDAWPEGFFEEGFREVFG